MLVLHSENERGTQTFTKQKKKIQNGGNLPG